MIAMILTKNNPSIDECDCRYEKKNKKRKNQNVFVRKDDKNLPTK